MNGAGLARGGFTTEHTESTKRGEGGARRWATEGHGRSRKGSFFGGVRVLRAGLARGGLPRRKGEHEGLGGMARVVWTTK